MRIEVTAKLPFRDRADALADFFRGKWPAATADPQRIAGDRRRRPTHQLRPVLGNISFDATGEGTWEGYLERPRILGLARTEGNSPLITATLHAGADGHGGNIARSYGTSREDANHQSITEQQGATTCRQSAAFLGPLHELNT